MGPSGLIRHFRLLSWRHLMPMESRDLERQQRLLERQERLLERQKLRQRK